MRTITCGVAALVLGMGAACNWDNGACYAPPPEGGGQGGGPIVPGPAGGGLGDDPGGPGVEPADASGSQLDCGESSVECRCTGKVYCEWAGLLGSDPDDPPATRPFHWCPIQSEKDADGGDVWIHAPCSIVRGELYDICRDNIVALEKANGTSYTDKRGWRCTNDWLSCVERKR